MNMSCSLIRKDDDHYLISFLFEVFVLEEDLDK